MSEQIIENKTSVELNEQDLDLVVGGISIAQALADAAAFGRNTISTTNTFTETTPFSSRSQSSSASASF